MDTTGVILGNKVDFTEHEKQLDPSHVERAEQAASTGDEALKVLHSHFEAYTEEEETQVVRRIDWRLIPIMLVVNALQLIDKNTLSAAATYGLLKQANLKKQEYSLLVTLFYIGYLVAEYPSNYLMQKTRTGKYLTVNFILWGVVLTCSASATDFRSLAVCRFFLGVFEACINPGFVMITSSWWKTEEQARRVGLWYSAAGFVNIVVVLVFYAIAHVNVAGMYPYQWMFLIFGLITVIVGISLLWTLPDSPITCSFLNERQRMIAVERLRNNKTGIKNKEHKKYQVIEALKDPKVWMLTFGVFFQNMTNALQNSFLGLILRGFGYSTYDAVLLTMPGSAVVGVVCLSVTWFLGTKSGQNKRIFTIMCCYVPGIVSTAILYSVRVEESNKGVLLFAVFFLNTISTCASVMYSLLASNVAGYTKKSITNTLFFIGYSLGNIISPQAFLQTQAPRYQTGIAVTLASFCANIVLFATLYIIYSRSNSKRDKEAMDQPPVDADEELHIAFSDLTDLENKSMRYTL